MELLKKSARVAVGIGLCGLLSQAALGSPSLVFHISEQTMNQGGAALACQAAGGRLATYAELVYAQQHQGAEWCSSGWLSDRGAPAWPMQSWRSNCGGPGIVWGLDSGGLGKSGANCFTTQTSVFHIPYYDKTQEQAHAACRADGGRLADLADVDYAWREKKAEWCSGGWTADQQSPVWPMQVYRQGCGGPGVVWGPHTGWSGKAGANCVSSPPALKNFNVVVMGDPQLYRTKSEGDPNERNEVALKVNRDQVRAIQRLGAQPGKLAGVIINGDLTEFGHNDPAKTQLDDYEAIYDDQLGQIWPGLGNHDYANNVDQCYENNCAVRMVAYHHYKVSSALDVVSFDYAEELAHGRRWISGSLSYSWDLGDYRFIQLNNYPDYRREFSGFYWKKLWEFWTRDGTMRTIDIQSSIDNGWLRGQLDRALAEGKKVVLNMHSINADGNSGGERGKLDALMKNYSHIDAVFMGHFHERLGRCDTIGNQVAIYSSGSPMYSTMLLAKVDAATGLSVDAYRTLDGQVTLLGSASTCRHF